MDKHIHHNLLTLHTKIRSANIPTELAFTTISNVQTATRALWHKCLGHISPARLNKMMTSATGIKFKERTAVNEHCESCALTKLVRIASGNKTTNKNFLPLRKLVVTFVHTPPSMSEDITTYLVSLATPPDTSHSTS